PLEAADADVAPVVANEVEATGGRIELRSDIEDRAKFYPPTGRFYLVRHDGRDIGVGCLKRLAQGVGEIQRMYIQPHVRGIGAGRALVQRLLRDAKELGYAKVRLESLRALAPA